MPIRTLASEPRRLADAKNGLRSRTRGTGFVPFAGLALISIGLTTLAWIAPILLLSGCGAAPLARTEPSAAQTTNDHAAPPFYRVEGHGGARLLLLGTIHIGPEDGWQFSDAVVQSVARADRVVLEIDLRDATEEEVSTQLANRVILDHTQTLGELISPETARLLDENEVMLAELGMGRRSRNRMKPWFVAMSLIESISNRSGYSTGASVEVFLLDGLGARPLIGLETLDQQMEMLDGLPPELQDVMLQDTLSRLDDATEGVEELVAAWRVGDEVELARIAREGVAELPNLDAFYDRLLSDRNRRWLDTLRRLLDSRDYANETILVGVGALHLVGNEGLVSLLREAGYRVESIAQRAGSRGDVP
jgi:uncharacterized protein YbaP (TraB family)